MVRRCYRLYRFGVRFKFETADLQSLVHGHRFVRISSVDIVRDDADTR